MKLDNFQQRMSLMAVIMSTAAAGGGRNVATTSLNGRPSIFGQQMASMGPMSKSSEKLRRVGRRKTLWNHNSQGCFVSLAAVDHHVTEPMRGTQQQPRYVGTTTRKRFRKVEGEPTTTEYPSPDLFMKASPLVPPPSSDLPPWLARFSFEQSNGIYPELQRPPSPLLLQERLSSLRTSMSEKSHLSDKQMHLVVRAIETATKSDPGKLLGVMDFLSILVEYMEMDHEALISASFHYCACLTARETGSSTSQAGEECLVDGVAGFDVAYLRPLAGSGLEYFGSQSVKIAIDAARLKGIEAVASTYVSTTADDKQQQNYRPRASEFDDLRSLLLTVNAGRDWKALAIRCAASLFRLRGLQSARKANPNGKHPTTQEVAVGREALHVYAPLAEQLGMHRLKSELESSAFSILYRRQHQAVMSLCNNRIINDRSNSGSFVMRHGIPIPIDNNGHRGEEKDSAFIDSVDDGMKSVMEDITFRMKRILYEDETLMNHVENICVVARIKEPYSLWRKMLKIHSKHTAVGKKRHFMSPIFSVLDVPDAIAIRAILSARKLDPNEDDEVTSARERALCYHVYNLCQNNLPNYSVDTNGEYSNRFKDYIKNPKPNGYQSLHFSTRTRWHGEDWPFEVQVRSAEMHKVAEYGLAAHWRYKLDSSENHGLCSTNEESDSSQLDSSLPSLDDSPYAPLRDDLINGVDHDDIIRSDQIRARAEELAPYIEALSKAGSSLARERLFVFIDQAPSENSSQEKSPSKTILSLPSGATVLDAIREAKRKSGTSLLRSTEQEKIQDVDSKLVLKNGMATTMAQPLENGDILILCTDPIAHSANGSVLCS